MSMLSRATAARPTKGLGQETQAQLAGVQYIPLENRSVWTADWLPQESKALAIAVYYAGIRVLAETFAMLPLFVYRRLEGGGKDRAVDHPLYPVLHNSPNPEMSSFIWRELVMQNLVTWGNHYSEIVFDTLGRMQLWPLRPDRMEVTWGPDSQKVYVYTKATGERKKMRPGSVFHVPGMGADGLRGYSLLTLHRKTFELHDLARNFGISFYKNNARPAVVLSHPKSLTPGAVTRLASQMDELRGSGNAGKTVVLEEGLNLTEVGIPPEDAQYIETRTFQKREIATILRIQAHKLNDLERATFSNIGEQNQEFMQDTMQPWFSRFEGEGNRQLLDNDAEHFIAFLIKGYLRGNPKDEAEALDIQRRNGVINADDWREINDENPLPDGKGQTYWRPENMAEVGQVDAATTAEAAAAPMMQVVKSALRCPNCDALLARQAGPGTVIECRRCKTEVAA